MNRRMVKLPLPGRSMYGSRLFVALAVLVAAVAFESTQAHAVNLYVGTGAADTKVGKVDASGLGLFNPSFITVTTGGNAPDAVAADDQYVYWKNAGAGLDNAIGRVKRDGTGFTPKFIPLSTSGGTANMVLHKGYLYWTVRGTAYYDRATGKIVTVPGRIDRVKSDGSKAPEYGFIPNIKDTPLSLTTDGAYLYWSDENNTSPATDITSIRRARIDGRGRVHKFIDLPKSNFSWGVAAGVNGDKHLYFSLIGAAKPDRSGREAPAIGRVGLDGKNLDYKFVSGFTTSATVPFDLVTDGTYIYWGGINSVGRVKIDGKTDFDTKFVSTPYMAYGLAIDRDLPDSDPDPDPDPDPTPDPDPVPTTTPDPAPVPTTTPDPVPTTTPDPAPVPTTTPDPVPTTTPVPAPVPTTTPDPVPTTTPVPAPVPTTTPDPVPTTTPDSAPDPVPTTTPDPAPVPTTIPVPAPVPTTTPAPAPVTAFGELFPQVFPTVDVLAGSPVVPRSVVPRVVGLSLAQARKTIVDAGYGLGFVKKGKGLRGRIKEKKVVVMSQSVKPNAVVATGSIINLVVSSRVK